MKRHRWVVVVTYELTEKEADARIHGPAGDPIKLDEVNRLGIDGPGCLDCEILYTEPHAEWCPAPAFVMEEHR